MISVQIRKQWLAILPITLGAVIFSTSACEFHGANLAGFSRYHPLMQQHTNAPQFDTWQMKYDALNNLKAGDIAAQKVSFFIPTSYYDVTIKIEASDSIELLSDAFVRLSQMSEKYELKYRSNAAGAHSIKLTLSGKNAGTPVSLKRTISVQSI